MRPFFDSDIVINFNLSVEAIEKEKKIIENNKRVLFNYQKDKLISEGRKNWDKFYNHYKTKFFKDRKWIKVEFVSNSVKIGCGVGNTLIPLLLEYENCNFIGIDFSKNAINLLNEKWKNITCEIDITIKDDMSGKVCEFGSVNVILLIYVLSSVPPEKMLTVVENCYNYLKVGGYIILRDYGLYDLTQVRFANKKGKKISENFYVRGDNTFVYFFKTEELHDLFCQNNKFEQIENKYITRIVKNRKRKLEMKRIWVQSIFRKKIVEHE
uniref:tRNA N(3)-cytidine methyltransferase n=1 Tax=Piliocolobus tephrosceles TaxID=591936 RepID=A0A8C9GZR8_9PRIM